MARTWTLYATLSVVSGLTLDNKVEAVNNAGQTIVYFAFTGSTHTKVYSWDGVTLTDISGTTFPTASGTVWAICVFDGNLFAAFGPTRFPLGPGTDIYRYTSGTSWTNEYTLAGEPANPDPGWIAQGSALIDNCPRPMDCDANFMHVAGNLSTMTSDTFRRMWSRNTAGSWTINQMPGSTYPTPGYQVIGLKRGSDYSAVFGYNRLSSINFQPILRGSPSPWTNLTPSGIGAAVGLGYGDGKSFFSYNVSGTVWDVRYSTDWGQSLNTAGGINNFLGVDFARYQIKNVGDGVIMLGNRTTQAYTWDSGLANFVADGTTTRTIYDYFVINDQLFALCDSASSNSMEIWSAGTLGCSASFYYGIEVPQLIGTLPFCVEPGGLAISPETNIAVLGTAGPAGQSVIYQLPPYNLPTWNNISGIVPTGTAVTSIKFV